MMQVFAENVISSNNLAEKSDNIYLFFLSSQKQIKHHTNKTHQL
jgi:hypothetical protein